MKVVNIKPTQVRLKSILIGSGFLVDSVHCVRLHSTTLLREDDCIFMTVNTGIAGILPDSTMVTPASFSIEVP